MNGLLSRLKGGMLAGNLVMEREGVPFAVGGREHGFQRDGGHAQPAQGLQELGCLQGRKMGHHQHFIRKGAGCGQAAGGSMPHRAASVSPYSEGDTGRMRILKRMAASRTFRKDSSLRL